MSNQEWTNQRNWQHWVHKTQDEDITKKTTTHKTICVGHHYTQTNTNNVNKVCALLQTTGDKDEPNIVIMRKS